MNTHPNDYPLFSGKDFPKHSTQYVAPVVRNPSGKGTMVLFSVDWEKDHGIWRLGGGGPTYGGVSQGTPVLCEILDELRIPCTWFIERHSSDPRLDMVLSCEPEFEMLRGRVQDGLGLHIHWANHAGEKAEPWDLSDRARIQTELGHCTEALATASGRPVVAFRSGGHIRVPSLPEMLVKLGYRCDASVEDRRSSRVRRLHSMLGFGVDAYQPDSEDNCLLGNCDLIEVPTSLHLHDFDNLRRAWRRFFPAGRQRVISAYIHIDELTKPGSAAGGKPELDRERVDGLKRLLAHWREQPDLEWVVARQVAAKLLPNANDMSGASGRAQSAVSD